MSNHDESLIDKVKNAFGMGDDEHADHEGHADHDVAGRGIDTDPLDTSARTEGWAGVDDALDGSENRPAGPDYGGGDPVTGTNDDAFGTTAAPLGGGASGSYTGVGESLDPDRQGTGEAGWTRGEAASGESGFDDDARTDDPLNPRRDDTI
jgi:hypothetical protein